MVVLEELYHFLEEYAAFYEKLAEEERVKLEALLSNDLDLIERAVAKQQAASMQMDQYEKKRMELQQALGHQDLTLSSLVEQVPASDKDRVQHVADRLREAVEQVKFYNNKSMDLVKTNLELINGELPPSERALPQSYTQKGKQDAGWGRGSSLIDAKI